MVKIIFLAACTKKLQLKYYKDHRLLIKTYSDDYFFVYLTAKFIELLNTFPVNCIKKRTTE